MDIAALSMSLSSTKLQMNVGLSMTKKVMEQQEVQSAQLLKMLEGATLPSQHKIDIKV